MSRTLPSSPYLRKGTLVPIPINSLELGVVMVLPHSTGHVTRGQEIYLGSVSAFILVCSTRQKSRKYQRIVVVAGQVEE
jgi:hypothetical protein